MSEVAKVCFCNLSPVEYKLGVTMLEFEGTGVLEAEDEEFTGSLYGAKPVLLRYVPGLTEPPQEPFRLRKLVLDSLLRERRNMEDTDEDFPRALVFGALHPGVGNFDYVQEALRICGEQQRDNMGIPPTLIQSVTNSASGVPISAVGCNGLLYLNFTASPFRLIGDRVVLVPPLDASGDVTNPGSAKLALRRIEPKILNEARHHAQRSTTLVAILPRGVQSHIAMMATLMSWAHGEISSRCNSVVTMQMGD